MSAVCSPPLNLNLPNKKKKINAFPNPNSDKGDCGHYALILFFAPVSSRHIFFRQSFVTCYMEEKKTNNRPTSNKKWPKKTYIMVGSILSLYGERNKNISVASCMEGEKAFLEEKQKQNASPTFRASRLERW